MQKVTKADVKNRIHKEGIEPTNDLVEIVYVTWKNNPQLPWGRVREYIPGLLSKVSYDDISRGN